MPKSYSKNKKQSQQEVLFSLMDKWPKSWMGCKEDIPLGIELVRLFKPFILHLQKEGLSNKTIRNHLDHLWVIGGEIIRKVNLFGTPGKISAKQLVLESIQDGYAPLAKDATESEQELLDAAARKLLKFLLKGIPVLEN